MKLISFLSFSYYGVCLMIVCTIAALVVSIVCYRRHKTLRIFPYYIASSLFSDMAVLFAFLYWPGDDLLMAIMSASRYAFLIFEFIVFSLFILRSISSPLWRRIIRINVLVFFVLLAIAVALAPRHLGIQPMHYILLQSVFLVPPCLIYFYRLFQTTDLQPLKDQPSFWVITGMLFLKACSIPLMLTVTSMVGHENEAYTLNYILYSLLFVLLIRAYFCAPPNSQPLTGGNSTRGLA